MVTLMEISRRRPPLDQERLALVKLCRERAENIYQARDYCCSEAVLAALGRGFKRDLDEQATAGLGSGFCKGMGGAGCLCGALAGAQIALSLLLGPRTPGGLSKKEFATLVRGLHDSFKGRYHATCCRSLRARRRSKGGAECRELTAGAAELAAALLLQARPELSAGLDLEFLRCCEAIPAGSK